VGGGEAAQPGSGSRWLEVAHGDGAQCQEAVAGDFARAG
jgi:hypothetical protein